MAARYDTPAMTREPVMRHWETVEYTASNGKTVRTKSGHNAIIDLFGALVMPGSIRHYETDAGRYIARQTLHDLNAFRIDGSMVEVGWIEWPSTASDYQRYQWRARR